MYDLSLLILTKNEENKIAHMLNSVKSIAKEIIVVDTGSTDNTKKIIKEIAPHAKIYPHRFINFSDLLNKGIRHCTSKWIMFLDADEYILPEHLDLFEPILNQDKYDCLILPRRHWRDLEMTKEYTAPYPDRQTRVFLNNGKISFVRPVHCGIIGTKALYVVENGLHIQHFNTYYDTPDDFGRKDRLYKSLVEPIKSKEIEHPVINKDEAKTIALELKDIFDRHHITFFLLAGTCLGAIREKYFIGDDRDIDFGFYGNPLFGDLVVSELQEKGYEFFNHNGKNPLLPLYKNNFRIDFIRLYQNNEIYYYYSNNPMQIKVFPNRMFDTLDVVDFLGTSFCVPHNPEEYLTLSYGDWKTPDENGRCQNYVLSKTPELLVDYINKGVYNPKTFRTLLCE